MKYRSFFLKCVVFIVLFVAVDFLLGKLYRLLENKALERSPYGMVSEYTMWKVESDVVVIGASEATHSYVPSILGEELGRSVYNCGRDGSRFYYQNAMIRGMLDRYCPNMILWSVSPTELSAPRAGADNGLSELSVFCKENEFCRQALRTKSKYESIKLLLNSYIYNSHLLLYLYNMFFANYQYDRGYAPLYGSSANTNFDENRLDEHYDESIGGIFEETLERCTKNNIHVVLVFTPRFKFMEYSTFESYIKLKAIADKYNVPLLEDMYHHKDLMKPEFFKDNSHLNHQGATHFSRMLASEVKQIVTP